MPADWADHSVISFVAPDEDGLAANVVITTAACDGAWRADVDRELMALRRQAKSYRLLADRELEHHGDPARLIEHRFISPDQLPIRQIQLYVFRGDTLYTASISHFEGAFEKSRARFDGVLSGLRFGGGV